MREKIIRAALAAVLILSAFSGCNHAEHVESLQNTRWGHVGTMFGDVVRSREVAPVFEVSIKLPPGTYVVPESGWPLADVKYRGDLALPFSVAMGQMDYGISEHVAITALRVTAPLAGFIAGQYFTNQAMKTALGSVEAMSRGSFDFASTVHANPPTPIILQ